MIQGKKRKERRRKARLLHQEWIEKKWPRKLLNSVSDLIIDTGRVLIIWCPNCQENHYVNKAGVYGVLDGDTIDISVYGGPWFNHYPSCHTWVIEGYIHFSFSDATGKDSKFFQKRIPLEPVYKFPHLTREEVLEKYPENHYWSNEFQEKVNKLQN